MVSFENRTNLADRILHFLKNKLSNRCNFIVSSVCNLPRRIHSRGKWGWICFFLSDVFQIYLDVLGLSIYIWFVSSCNFDWESAYKNCSQFCANQTSNANVSKILITMIIDYLKWNSLSTVRYFNLPTFRLFIVSSIRRSTIIRTHTHHIICNYVKTVGRQ